MYRMPYNENAMGKNKSGKRLRSVGGCGIAMLNRMIREGLAEMTFEQRSEGGEIARHAGN